MSTPVFQVNEEIRKIRGHRQCLHFIGRPQIAVVIPFHAEGTLIMVRTTRPGLGSGILEFPAGKCEPLELPVEAAARELLEETGFIVSKLAHIGGFHTAPHFSDEFAHAFVAKGFMGAAQQLTDAEEIEPVEVSRDQLESSIRSGELSDAKSLAAWLVYLRCEVEKKMELWDGES